MSVSLISRVEDWCRERDAWGEVYASNSNHTPFQCFEWQEAWWRSFGNGHLYILRIDDGNGVVLGYAPLYLRGKYFGFPLRHLSFIGDKRTDYLDFLVRADSEAPFFEQLFSYLAACKKDFSFIELRDLPESSSNHPSLVSAVSRHFSRQFQEVNVSCVVVPLMDSWAEQLATLSKRARKDVSYDRRFFARHHQVRFAEYRDMRDIEAIYPALMAVYRQRWADTLGATRYDDHASAEFEKNILEAFSSRGDCRVWVLFADDQAVAWADGYIHANKVFADTNVHAPAYHKYSVGNVLLGYILEACVDAGFSEFDLSRGVEPYKYRWGGQEKHNLRLLVASGYWPLQPALLAKNFYQWTTTSPLAQRGMALLRGLKGHSGGR